MKKMEYKKVDDKLVCDIEITESSLFEPITDFIDELDDFNLQFVKTAKEQFAYNPHEKNYNALYTYAAISALMLILEVGKFYGVIDFNQLHKVMESHRLFDYNITREIDTEYRYK